MGPFATVQSLSRGLPVFPVPSATGEVAPAEARPPLRILFLAGVFLVRVGRFWWPRLVRGRFLHDFFGQFFVPFWG